MVYMQQQRLDTRKREQADYRLVRQTALVEVLTYATTGIAAHHGFAAIGIEDVHREVGLGNGAASDEHQTVRTDALIPVAVSDSESSGISYRVQHSVDVDVVVAAAVHLGEWYLLHLVR